MPPVCSTNLFISVGPSELFGDMTAIFVCVRVRVFVCCKGGVLGSLCNLVRYQLQLAQKKRERKHYEGRECHLSIFPLLCYVFAQTGTQRISTTLTTVCLTESLEKTIKEGEVALHLITQHNSPDTFTIWRSPDCNGVLCLQRGHSGTRLLLLIIVVHC